jgi:hypothetical protein
MLAHSPLLPLIIDRVYERRDITAEDELIVAAGEEYPILEYLIVWPLTQERRI